MKIRHLLITLSLLLGLSVFGQTFAPPFQGFSRKKTTFITLKDGSEISVRIKNLAFKKGLIDQMKVVMASDGSKVKLNPEDIKHMYVPPSALAKLNQALEAATDLTRIQDNELSSEHLDDGYLYMESCNVQVNKRKTQYCMLQVMNPTFSKKVTVYNDPLSAETMSVGVGGMTLAGGLDKSYYIKKDGEEIARRIKKKEFRKDMEELFAECPKVLEMYGERPKWSDFEKFIYDYSTMCE